MRAVATLAPVKEKLSNVTEVLSFEPGCNWFANSIAVTGDVLVSEKIRLPLKYPESVLPVREILNVPLVALTAVRPLIEPFQT